MKGQQGETFKLIRLRKIGKDKLNTSENLTKIIQYESKNGSNTYCLHTCVYNSPVYSLPLSVQLLVFVCLYLFLCEINEKSKFQSLTIIELILILFYFVRCLKLYKTANSQWRSCNHNDWLKRFSNVRLVNFLCID